MNGYQSDMARTLFAGDQKAANSAKRDVTAGINEIYEELLKLLRTEASWSLLAFRFHVVRFRTST